MPFFDHYGVAPVSGELEFAQSMEAVEMTTVADLLAEAECTRARRRAAQARAAVGLAREEGDGRGVAFYSRILREAEAICVECRDEEPVRGGLTLSRVLAPDGEEEDERTRARYFRVFLEFCTQGVVRGDLGPMLRNVLALCSKVAPDLLGGMSTVEIAKLTGESKQAAHARAKRLVTAFAKKAGIAGHLFHGANATEAARENMSRAAQGNKNRSNKARRDKGLPEVPAKKSPRVSTSKPAPSRKRSRLMRFGLDEAAALEVVVFATGERRRVGTLRAALAEWTAGGLLESAGGSASRQTAVVMLLPSEGGRPVRIATLTAHGEVLDQRGEAITG